MATEARRKGRKGAAALTVALLPGVVVHVRRLARLLHQLPQQRLRLLRFQRPGRPRHAVRMPADEEVLAAGFRVRLDERAEVGLAVV